MQRELDDAVILGLIKKNSGGGSGTSDYSALSNKPQINGNVLTGNKTGEQLGLVSSEDGKGLSSNDFSNEDKQTLDSLSALIKDGSPDYENLDGLPTIEGKEVKGDLTLEDIGDVPIPEEDIISAVNAAFGS